MKSVAIVGVGLIGGSFGLALRDAGFDGDLIGVSSKPAIEAGLKTGAIQRSASLREAAESVNVIYLAQPVDRILSTIEELANFVRPGVFITDAGSTKQAIVEQAARFLPTVQFLGGHPLAGKEQRGSEAAQADLFCNKRYILTPHLPESTASAEFRNWLRRIGATIIDLSAKQHDETVALTSHLPQVLSTALAVTLSRHADQQVRRVFGPGLVDMTRLARSSADLWMPILRTNRAAVAQAIEEYSTTLSDLHKLLNSDTLMELFEAGADWAAKLQETSGNGDREVSA